MIFNLYDKGDRELIQRACKDQIIGLTSGSFDMIHGTHDQYLETCHGHCGVRGLLFVGVDSDDLVRERKGPNRPMIPEAERLQMVANRKNVTGAFILRTALDFGYATKILKAKKIFKNQDYKDMVVYGADQKGVELVIVPDFHRTESTTALIKKVIDSHVKN